MGGVFDGILGEIATFIEMSMKHDLTCVYYFV
jgi:hypothetical protein